MARNATTPPARSQFIEPVAGGDFTSGSGVNAGSSVCAWKRRISSAGFRLRYEA